jgi:hypothetical protein
MSDGPATKKAREALRDTYLENGMNMEQADRLAGFSTSQTDESTIEDIPASKTITEDGTPTERGFLRETMLGGGVRYTE